mgnify:CR=1 FL=1
MLEHVLLAELQFTCVERALLEAQNHPTGAGADRRRPTGPVPTAGLGKGAGPALRPKPRGGRTGRAAVAGGTLRSADRSADH